MSKVAKNNGQRKVPVGMTTDTTGIGLNASVGVYVAIVKDNRDDQRMGRLRVYIPEFNKGSPKNEDHWITVSYASPLAGSTSIFDLGNNVEEYSDTMKPYGMWVPQPDIDSEVLVTFAAGKLDAGFWFACLYNRGTQVTVPGIPGKRTYTDPNVQLPAAPKNKKDKNPDLNIFVEHKILADALRKQGLIEDPLRGLTSSSAIREAPSKVFGVLTPGQHQFVMDDGDENGDNRLIRLRTTNGAQILIDDTSGHIYANSKDGQSWVELSNDGQIHIYGAKDINVRSEANINLRSDKSINIEAVDNISMSAGKDILIQSGSSTNVTAGTSTNLTSGTTSNIKSTVGHYETAGVIHMNGPEAATAATVVYNSLPVNTGVTSSICNVVPEHEPWWGHAGKTNPIGPGNQQLKKDPAPEKIPRLPANGETAAPITTPYQQGEMVDVATVKASDSVVEMIAEANGFTPVNIIDGDGISIGYGSVLTDSVVEEVFDDSDIFDDLSFGDIDKVLESDRQLLSTFDSSITENLDEMEFFALHMAQQEQLDAAIASGSDVLKQLYTNALPGNNFIPNDSINVMTKGVTPERAKQMLLNDISMSEESVKSVLSGIDTVPQNVFDSLVSLDNEVGDVSYAFVAGEKIDLTQLYANGEWSRASSFIAADDRNRSRRIKEAVLMNSNVYPVTSPNVVEAGFKKAAENLTKGVFNAQQGKPADVQQAISTATGYFRQFGEMPAGLNTATKLKVAENLKTGVFTDMVSKITKPFPF